MRGSRSASGACPSASGCGGAGGSIWAAAPGCIESPVGGEVAEDGEAAAGGESAAEGEAAAGGEAGASRGAAAGSGTTEEDDGRFFFWKAGPASLNLGLSGENAGPASLNLGLVGGPNTRLQSREEAGDVLSTEAAVGEEGGVRNSGLSASNGDGGAELGLSTAAVAADNWTLPSLTKI